LLDFVSKRKWFFLASGIIIVAGIIALIVSGGLKLGIEFSSGTTMNMVFENSIGQGDLRTSMADLGYPDAIIQRSAQNAFLVQGLALSTVQSERDQQEEQLVNNLQTKFNTTIRIAEFGTEGNTTAGNATLGNETLGNETLGNETLGNTTSGNETLGNETSGNETLGNETLGNITSGNTTFALIFGKTVDPSDLSSQLVNLGYTGATVNQTTLDSYLVRTRSVSTQQKAQIQQALEQKFGPMNYLDFATISPEVSGQRVKYNIYAIIAAAVAILLYMAWAFRKLASPFRYGTCAIVALLHDVLIMLAVFAIFRIEVDSMFIIAILTIIGFGVNNVIVVFDRLRESKVVESRFDLATRVNMGITETITRSINTSLTVLFTLFALYAFGGSTIHNFMLALIVGVIASTYSSLFIAGQLLVSWEVGDFGKLFSWLPIRRQKS
jgi:preprotein translocase subunit SecF